MKRLTRTLICLIACSLSLTLQAKTTPYNDTKLHIILTGTGTPDSLQLTSRHPNSLVIIGDKNFALIDAGAGIVQRLDQLKLPLAKLDKAFITHWHSDHFSGLGAVVNGSWISGRQTPFTVYGPFGVKQIIHGLNQQYQFDILFRSINRKGKLDPNLGNAKPALIDLGQNNIKPVWHNKNVSISAFRVEHEPVYPAYGYVIRYKSCKVIVSGDTRVFDGLKPIEHNADAFITEALSNALMKKSLAKHQTVASADIGHYHSDTLQIAKLAQKAGVRQLVLTHLEPPINNSQHAKQQFIAGMPKHYHGPIHVAMDGDQLVLSEHNGQCRVRFLTKQQQHL